MSILSALKKKFNAKGNNIEEAIKTMEVGGGDKDTTTLVVECNLTSKTAYVSSDIINQAFKDNRPIRFVAIKPASYPEAPYAEYEGIYYGQFYNDDHRIANLGVRFFTSITGTKISGYNVTIKSDSSLTIEEFNFNMPTN